MDSSKFLIVGANGQLGRALREQYPDAQHVDHEQLDITNTKAVQAYDWSGVTHILNAAAYTNVDGAETPEGKLQAWRVNSMGVGNLASMAIRHELTLVQISTEYVFDGTKKSFYTENDPFSPLNEYGRSKAEGDKLAAAVKKHYILRTSWVIGDGKNIVRTMLGLAENGVNPTVIADNEGRPTFTGELVRAVDHLLVKQAPYGTYNVSNDGEPTNWAEFTRAIFDEAGYHDATVTDTTTAEYYADKPGAAKRPLNSILDLAKLHSTGFVSVKWSDGLQAFILKEQDK
jgi:dTDP-4-dehydrorhamnose 3,5-epimerase